MTRRAKNLEFPPLLNLSHHIPGHFLQSNWQSWESLHYKTSEDSSQILSSIDKKYQKYKILPAKKSGLGKTASIIPNDHAIFSVLDCIKLV